MFSPVLPFITKSPNRHGSRTLKREEIPNKLFPTLSLGFSLFTALCSTGYLVLLLKKVGRLEGLAAVFISQHPRTKKLCVQFNISYVQLVGLPCSLGHSKAVTWYLLPFGTDRHYFSVNHSSWIALSGHALIMIDCKHFSVLKLGGLFLTHAVFPC